MTVNELIERLQLVEDKAVDVIITDPNQLGWTNIKFVNELSSQVNIVGDDATLFADNL
ncbi:MAG: hypothetical protein KQ78_02107 [Candidatus Izimaplasma bacterium HR2]|nr:MAG: hypothetical protein KQ78_02107 [Candidatus Izimaplasma bacterium HR2]